MTLRILIFALMLTAIHAQEPTVTVAPKECATTCTGEVHNGVFYETGTKTEVAYQTARANALEAENAVLKLQIKNLNMQIVQYQATIGNLTADWPNPQQLQAAQATAQKALDAARDVLKKACGDKWDEVKSTCGK